MCAVFLAGWFMVATDCHAADFVVQANGAGRAHASVNAAIASPGGASGKVIEIRSDTPGTLQVFAQTIDLSGVSIRSDDESDWLTIRVREGDRARFRADNTHGIGFNGHPNGVHGTVISGHAIGGPSARKQIHLKSPVEDVVFPIDSPPLACRGKDRGAHIPAAEGR